MVANTQAGDPAIGAVNAGGTADDPRQQRSRHRRRRHRGRLRARQHDDPALDCSSTARRTSATPCASSTRRRRSRSSSTARCSRAATPARASTSAPAATTIALRGVTIAPVDRQQRLRRQPQRRAPPDRRPSRRSTARCCSTARVARRERRAGDLLVQRTCRRPAVSGTPNCPTTDGNPLGNTEAHDERAAARPGLRAAARLARHRLRRSRGRRRRRVAGRPPRPPRAPASSADTCDAGPGIRDKGAFERYRPLPAVAISGPDSLPAGTADVPAAVTDSRDPVFTWACGDGAAGGGCEHEPRGALGARRVEDHADRQRPRLQLLERGRRRTSRSPRRPRGGSKRQDRAEALARSSSPSRSSASGTRDAAATRSPRPRR